MTDQKEPQCYKRGKALYKNRKANSNNYLEQEHTRELQSLKARLEKVGSWQHRKKNGCDPLANPVWFFKGKNRDPDLDKKLDLAHFENNININVK